MPLLRSARQPEIQSLGKYLSHLSGVSQTGDIKEDRKVFSFALDGFSFNAIVVGTAIPWKDLEGPCHTCRTWPEAIDEVRQHTAHAIVTVDHETAGYKELAWYLTKGIEALLPALDSIGVYWGAGTTISSSKAFHALSSESSLDFLPLYLWIDFRSYPENESRVSFFTSGMKALGHMEIEIKESGENPTILLDLVYNFAHYLLDNGPVIKNGQTFGMTEEQRILVSLVPSFTDRDQTVYRLEL